MCFDHRYSGDLNRRHVARHAVRSQHQKMLEAAEQGHALEGNSPSGPRGFAGSANALNDSEGPYGSEGGSDDDEGVDSDDYSAFRGQ